MGTRQAADYRIPHREVKTRRIRFSYPTGGMNRHYVDGDLVMSHVVAVLSATFPEGEEFFVRSVRNFKDDVTHNAELKSQVAGFIGQEVTHGREHRALNERLQQMGYPTRPVDRFVWFAFTQFFERVLPKRAQLAITAALEHYTATLAEILLHKPEAQALLGETEVRSMLLWHALEESEHKAVAFDVYRAVGGKEWMRILTMRLISLGFLLFVVAATVASLAGDRAAYHPVRLARSVAALRHSPFLGWDVARHIAAYNRRGFHPDDFDATELLQRWRAELFGEQGSLADHLK